MSKNEIRLLVELLVTLLKALPLVAKTEYGPYYGQGRRRLELPLLGSIDEDSTLGRK